MKTKLEKVKEDIDPDSYLAEFAEKKKEEIDVALEKLRPKIGEFFYGELKNMKIEPYSMYICVRQVLIKLSK
jgi:hypothetical protein